MAQMRAATPSTYHLLLPSRTPPLLPVPIPAPSTSRRADNIEQTRRLLRYLRGDDGRLRKEDNLKGQLPCICSAVERVWSFYSYNTDAQKDRVAVRAEIEVWAYSREYRHGLQMLRHRRRRHEGSVRKRGINAATRHIMRIQALEAGARDDTLEILGIVPSLARLYSQLSIDWPAKIAPKRTTRSTPVTPTLNATTTTTVTEAQLQALIDQGVAAAMAEVEASRVRNGYDSNGSGPRPAQAVHECSYSEFPKCKPLDFKGTEGVVELT
ncbi:hypothetical protein Tco_0312867 [Tanacetum coccineum]